MKSSIFLNIILFLTLFINFSNGQLTPQDAISQMARGINIGNTMEPPNEGGWNNGSLQEYYFDDYKNAGFTCVRIPITWDGHTSVTSPYTIDSAWLARVEQVVDWGLSRDLIIIINAHHESWIKDTRTYESLKPRLDSIWSQISVRFKDKSEKLIFEMINEPTTLELENIQKALSLSQVNELNSRILGIIRKTNPTRNVIFSGNRWSNADELVLAAIPVDNYLIGYYHSYDPYPFGLTGQGTYGSNADIAATTAKFTTVKNWSVSNNIPVLLGEFGYQKLCAYNSRMLAYATVVRKAIENNIALAAWDDGGDFPLYIRATGKWSEIKDILIYTYPESPSKLKVSEPDSNQIVIEWTNNTTNNDSIVIERKSGSAAFDTIAIIAPEMNRFIDTSVVINTTYYYRLQTNIGDSITLMSYPISIKKGIPTGLNNSLNDDDFSIFPNPANENIKISWPSETGNIELSILDYSGKTILRKKIENIENRTFFELDISKLLTGTYILKLTGNDTFLSKKIYINK
jgi:aryl-phospho-beta-D-glucosidase BglC (GH1 family)